MPLAALAEPVGPVASAAAGPAPAKKAVSAAAPPSSESAPAASSVAAGADGADAGDAAVPVPPVIAQSDTLPPASAAPSFLPIGEPPPEPEKPIPPPVLPGEAHTLSPSSSGTAPAPSASAEAEAPKKPAEAVAKIHDTVVFPLRLGRGDKTAEERARVASEALTRAVETPGAEEVRIAQFGEAYVVYAGTIPIVEIRKDDAEAAGYQAAETHARAVAARAKNAILSEKKRSAIAGTVFSLSLLVFFGLIAFYVLRKAGEFFERARQWLIDNPERISGLRVQSQEVISSTALRGGALVTLLVGRFIAQISIVYLWLVFALSLFDSTREYTGKLTGFVFAPLSALTGRIAASLPLAVVAVVSGVAMYVLFRFVQLFFEGVARRQTVIPWLPPDLAAPTSVLVRAGIVLTVLAFAAPIVTGDSDGALGRAGNIALLALGIASTPLVASVIMGVLVVYGRRVRVGQHTEVGGRAGKVVAVGLVDVRLLDPDGCEVRVPHLLSLVHPTRVLGTRPRASVTISADASHSLEAVLELLRRAAADLGERPQVELTHADGVSSRFRVVVSVAHDTTESDVRLALALALSQAGIGLGRHAPPGGAS
jgi:small-conductance mechanosensitive channel